MPVTFHLHAYTLRFTAREGMAPNAVQFMLDGLKEAMPSLFAPGR